MQVIWTAHTSSRNDHVLATTGPKWRKPSRTLSMIGVQMPHPADPRAGSDRIAAIARKRRSVSAAKRSARLPSAASPTGSIATGSTESLVTGVLTGPLQRSASHFSSTGAGESGCQISRSALSRAGVTNPDRGCTGPTSRASILRVAATWGTLSRSGGEGPRSTTPSPPMTNSAVPLNAQANNSAAWTSDPAINSRQRPSVKRNSPRVLVCGSCNPIHASAPRASVSSNRPRVPQKTNAHRFVSGPWLVSTLNDCAKAVQPANPIAATARTSPDRALKAMRVSRHKARISTFAARPLTAGRLDARGVTSTTVRGAGRAIYESRRFVGFILVVRSL
jgi:hypothetical protein